MKQKLTEREIIGGSYKEREEGSYTYQRFQIIKT